MAVGAVIYALLGIVAVASRQGSAQTDALLVGTVVYSLVVAIVLLTVQGRLPMWLLQAQVVASILLTSLLIAGAPTPVAATNLTLRYVAIVVYVAFWMSWRVTAAMTGLVTVASLSAYVLGANDVSELMLTWLAVSVLSWALALLVNYLSRSVARHATVDSLTGMLNRGALPLLIDLLEEPGRAVVPRALVVVDLDYFKALNDTRGHMAGDAALRELGAAWRATLRADDIAVRTGGDEFVLILPGTSPTDALALLDRLRKASPVSWTYGLVDWPLDEDFDAVVARADAELYRHKRQR